MRYKMKRLCSLLLVFALCIQSLVGCGSDTDKRSSSNVYVEESVIKEQTIAESTIDYVNQMTKSRGRNPIVGLT